MSTAPQFKRANLGQLVRPEDFRRSLSKMITMPEPEFEKAAEFTKAYRDSFIEAGWRGIEHDAVVMALAAFSHAMFERIY